MAVEPLKILIVDDEPGHIHWMKMVYRRFGLTVFTALNIDEAREILKREKPHILTLETYIYNSHWFLQEARQLNKQITRVVITTIRDPGYLDFLKTLGLAEYCLNKPSDDKEFQRLEDIIMEIASLVRLG